jgi:hypothetical protein
LLRRRARVHDGGTRAAMRSSALRVLDPACGSGAFLVHSLDASTTLRAPPAIRVTHTTVRRAVLTRSIFGVDRKPMAVWLCELRLWLSVIIDCDVADPDASPTAEPRSPHPRR